MRGCRGPREGNDLKQHNSLPSPGNYPLPAPRQTNSRHEETSHRPLSTRLGIVYERQEAQDARRGRGSVTLQAIALLDFEVLFSGCLTPWGAEAKLQWEHLRRPMDSFAVSVVSVYELAAPQQVFCQEAPRAADGVAAITSPNMGFRPFGVEPDVLLKSGFTVEQQLQQHLEAVPSYAITVEEPVLELLKLRQWSTLVFRCSWPIRRAFGEVAHLEDAPGPASYFDNLIDPVLDSWWCDPLLPLPPVQTSQFSRRPCHDRKA